MTGQQITLEAAVAEKERILTWVELEHEGFIVTMRKYARLISKQKGRVSADDLREFAGKIGIEAPNPNVWGTVFRGAGWLLVDRKKSTTKGNNAREIKVWKWIGGAE